MSFSTKDITFAQSIKTGERLLGHVPMEYELTSSGLGVEEMVFTNPSFWYFSMIGIVDVTYVRYLDCTLQ